SGTGFGLLLPWTLLPISLPRPLLPISPSRALLPAPGLGGRRQWTPQVLSLLVNGGRCADFTWLRQFHARGRGGRRSKLFTVFFYGLKIFGCKTARFCSRRRES